MDETREAVAATMRHPISGHTLDQRQAQMQYHHPDDPAPSYRGSIVSGIYFWCNTCGKAYMSASQFGNDEFKCEAHRYTFALASSHIPVEVVPWITQ